MPPPVFAAATGADVARLAGAGDGGRIADVVREQQEAGVHPRLLLQQHRRHVDLRGVVGRSPVGRAAGAHRQRVVAGEADVAERVAEHVVTVGHHRLHLGPVPSGAAGAGEDPEAAAQPAHGQFRFGDAEGAGQPGITHDLVHDAVRALGVALPVGHAVQAEGARRGRRGHHLGRRTVGGRRRRRQCRRCRSARRCQPWAARSSRRSCHRRRPCRCFPRTSCRCHRCRPGHRCRRGHRRRRRARPSRNTGR